MSINNYLFLFQTKKIELVPQTHLIYFDFVSFIRSQIIVADLAYCCPNLFFYISIHRASTLSSILHAVLSYPCEYVSLFDIFFSLPFIVYIFLVCLVSCNLLVSYSI